MRKEENSYTEERGIVSIRDVCRKLKDGGIIRLQTAGVLDKENCNANFIRDTAKDVKGINNEEVYEKVHRKTKNHISGLREGRRGDFCRDGRKGIRDC